MPYFFEDLPQTGSNRNREGYRLGRHVMHDEASKDFSARTLIGRRPRTLTSVWHKSVVEPWDQGEIGQCTAEAALGALMTEPFYREKFKFNGTGPNSDSLALYRKETRLDDRDIPTSWEPDDTGSTGLWSMKAMKAMGFIAGYRWAFSAMSVFQLLLDGPVSTGTAWYNSMFTPNYDAVISVDRSSGLAGGHQYLLVGMDIERDMLIVRNSWGVGWGHKGYAFMKFDDYYRLLADNGDAVVPVI